METLRVARERLKRDPNFYQLPSARRSWVVVEPSACPTAPETSSSGESSNTSINIPTTIHGGFDGFSNAKVKKHAVLEMPSVGKSPVLEPAILTVMFQSHQTGEGSDPPSAPRLQHAVLSAPSPTAYTQPSFRSPYVRNSPPTPPTPPPPRLLPLTTRPASLAPLPSATQNAPVPSSAPSSAAFSQPLFRSPYVQPSLPPSQSPWSTQPAPRTSAPSSTQNLPTVSTPSGTGFSQSSFSYPYVLPSLQPQPSTPPSYPSTHNHPVPASVPSSAAFSHPFFTSPYAQPHLQSVAWSTQFPSPTSIPSSTQNHPNQSGSSSSSQLPPST